MYKKWRVALILGIIVFATFFFYWQYWERNKYHFRVIFFNVGQGDAALINFSNGQKMLVDCGPDATVLSRLGAYLPFYDHVIDYLVVSHPDLDHYGGCIDVLKKYQVNNIIENGDQKFNDQYWQNRNLFANKERANRFVPTNKYTFWLLGGEKVEFFKTDEQYLLTKDNEGNNRSLVFRLSSVNNSFLFSGDAEVPLELALIKTFCPNGVNGCDVFQADYLKVGHHGSDSSSSEEWLEAVRPKFGIVSVGKNKFGHPSLRVIRKLERINAELWRTDQRGDIVI